MRCLVFSLLFVSLLLLCGCLQKECGSSSDCAVRDCFSVECRDNSCVFSPVSGCCGNGVCELGESYLNCSVDCPNCDDGSECTVDVFDFHELRCVSSPILDVVCCGNGLCQMGESYSSCSRDCPNCDDGDVCTVDSFDFHLLECVNKPLTPCCGDGFCVEGVESFSGCPVDCPSCDDGYALSVDSFDFSSQVCVNSPFLGLAEGFRYSYVTAHCRQCPEHDSFIYVTEESDRFWEGIAGIKMDDVKKAYLLRWRIEKDSLHMSVTLPLPKDSLSGDVVYLDDMSKIQEISEAGDSVLPFYMVMLQEMFGFDVKGLVTEHKTTLNLNAQQSAVFSASDSVVRGGFPAYKVDIEVFQDEKLTDSGNLVISVAEPYLVMSISAGDGPVISFKGAEEKEFSFDDFSGYSVSVWEPPPPEPKEPKPPKPESKS